MSEQSVVGGTKLPSFSYVVNVSSSLNMLTDRTRQVPDVAEVVVSDTFFSSGVTFTFKQTLLSIDFCTGCIAENDFKSTCCALTNTDSLCKGCIDSHYKRHLFLFHISGGKKINKTTKPEAKS